MQRTAPPFAETLVHMLAHSVQMNPHGEALVIADGVRLSWSGLSSSVSRLALEFRKRGAAGDRIAVALPNGADAVIAILAVLTSGAQVVLLNPFYSPQEIGPILRDAQPLFLVCSAAFYNAASSEVALSTRLPPIVTDDPFETFVHRTIDAVHVPTEFVDADDLAILQYTGGTTGISKGVDLTHRTTTTNILQREALLPTRFGRERFLCMTPLFHSYATATAFFPTVFSAGTLVVMPRYSAQRSLEVVVEERITLFCGAPTIYNGLVAHPDFMSKDYSSLLGAYSGGAPLSVSTLREWERVTHVPIAEGYGLTEATAILSFNPMVGVRKAGSVGLPLPGTEIETVDPDSGNALPRGEAGEIRARGPQLMRGYRNRPEATAETIRNGWLYTGDIGQIDEDGYIYIRDRKKDMAIVSGFNVFPREVDEVISAHPSVLEAVSFSVPDPYKGEIMQACVTLNYSSPCSQADILEHCSERLARYKRPERILIVPEILKTAAGKIDRKRMKDWFLKLQ